MRLFLFFIIAISTFQTLPSIAKTGLPIPRFVSLRASQINVRVGPGRHYPIEWVYVKPNYPVEITAEFDNWRKIRDIEGAEGWVHQSMLSGNRYVLVNQEKIIMKTKPKNDASELATLAEGVMGKLINCQGQWCKIQAHQTKGWVPKLALWGIYEEE